MPEEKPALTRKTWEEVQYAGLLWWVNRALHLFGWAIVLEIDTASGKVLTAYPARTRFRGFGPKEEDEGFKQLTDHLRTNADELLADCAWGGDAEPEPEPEE